MLYALRFYFTRLEILPSECDVGRFEAVCPTAYSFGHQVLHLCKTNSKLVPTKISSLNSFKQTCDRVMFRAKNFCCTVDSFFKFILIRFLPVY